MHYLRSIFLNRRKQPHNIDPPRAVAVRRGRQALDPDKPGLKANLGLTVADSPFELLQQRSTFLYDGAGRAAFYRFLRDRIPIVSAGIWTWVQLCSTPQTLGLSGDDRECRRAQRIADDLSRRIYPRADGDRRGFDRLVESAFLDLFTLGRVAMTAVMLPDRSGISHVQALDPHTIRWQTGPDGIDRPFREGEDDELIPLPDGTFFHRTLQPDLHNSDGIEPLACIPFVVEIEQRMLEDMAKSSHNAGTQRLQIRLTPPDRQPGEDYENWTSRVNSFFDRTVGQFKDLGPDDNVFTWNDVEVGLFGGAGKEGSVWKLNREQVIEDVITGLKLYPWVLGRSHGTTKNWVFAQYNLLMQIVDSVQQLGADLVEWLLRIELRLKDNLAEPRWRFAPNQDPFVVERGQARLMELDRVERLVAAGFISREQGIRELGYTPAGEEV